MRDCPLCGIPTDKVLTSVLRRGFGRVMHCEACDLGFLVDSEELPTDYYVGEYRRHASHRADGAPTNAAEIFENSKHHQESRLNCVRSFLNRGSRVLEIGASAGQFLHALDGHCARRCAIELDSQCCEFMRHMGIEVDGRPLRKSRFFQQQFDVVCAFQVLEHVRDPVFFLEDIRNVLAPHGHALIEVPNLHDPLLSVWGLKEYVPFYFHREHLFYFSRKALGILAGKAGYNSASFLFEQDYNLLNHLHWIMNRGPQRTNEIGLSPIDLRGVDERIPRWLSERMEELDLAYKEHLSNSGKTSNIMAILT